jgi:protein arginine N-methyltransferase 1
LRALADGWRREPVPAEFHWLADYAANSRHPYRFSADEIVTLQSDLGSFDLRAEVPAHETFSARVEVTRDGQLDGLGGWFVCQIVDGVTMSNSPLVADRINRCQVFLPFAEPLPVRSGDAIEIAVSLRHEPALLSWSARHTRTGRAIRQSTWKSTILRAEDTRPFAERIPRLDSLGAARLIVLALVDGKACNAEIEAAVMRRHPDLFPTAAEISRFVRDELLRCARRLTNFGLWRRANRRRWPTRRSPAGVTRTARRRRRSTIGPTVMRSASSTAPILPFRWMMAGSVACRPRKFPSRRCAIFSSIRSCR